MPKHRKIILLTVNYGCNDAAYFVETHQVNSRKKT